MLRKLLPVVSLVPVFINALLLEQSWLGILALMFFLLACGASLGSRLAANSPKTLQIGLGGLVSLALMSIGGGVIYYTAVVTTTNLLGLLVLIATVASLAHQSQAHTQLKLNLPNRRDLCLFTLGLTSLFGWWIALLNHDITEPVRSLWLVLDPFALIAIGMAASCLLTLLMRERATQLTLVLFTALLFSALAVTATMYGLGYGFDPFLHRAAVTYIAEHGTITPKPLYYIGQYALELIGLKIFALPLLALDVLLVPLLTAIGTVVALASRQTSLKTSSLTLASLCFMPLAAFVQTTPQALAFMFTAWTVLTPTRPRLVPICFALAALMTHPLAGIGAVAYVILLALDDLPPRYRAWRLASLGFVTLMAGVAIPLAFVAQAKLAKLQINFSFEHLLKLWQLPIETFTGSNFNAWGDLAYVFIGNAFLIVLVLALIGLKMTPKTKQGWYIPGLVALAMFVNFIILSLGFDFTFLIAYERLDFALRLLTLTTLFLLPYVAVALAKLTTQFRSKPVSLRLGFVVLLSIMFTSNVYAAYPRHDNYARSSGFNLGSADFETVRAIEHIAGNRDYIVLSNQALAAAAIQELGFKKYYPGNIFFYPIPTGGSLYQHFLTLVEDQPRLDTITSAMDLTGVDLAFFAVHDYWWQAPMIIENTKAIATDWFALNHGAITVFIFER